MKKQIILMLGITVWLSQTSMVLAEEPRSITLNQAVEAALTGNPDLLQSQNQISLAQINLRQKKAGFLPELSFSANGTKTFAEAEGSTGGNSTQARLNLSLDLNLFNGFADASALKVSRLEQLMAGQDFDRSRQTTVFNTIQAYLQTLISQGLIRVEEENLAAQTLQLGVITDFHQAGKRPKADLYQQQAEMARSELLLLEAKRSDHDRKLALMQLLGQSPRSDFQVLDPGAETIITRLEGVDMERLVSQAMDKRPDLQSRRLDTRAAAEGIRTAASGYWPKASLFADLGSSYSNLRDTSLTTQLFTDQVSGSVGLSLSVPVFDKSRTASAVASARVMEKNSRLLFEKARQQVELEIRQALEAYHSARQSLQVTKLQLVYARAALDSIEARYRIQASTLAELISARAQWTEARYNEVETRYNLLIRALALAYHSGDEQAMIRLIKM